MGKLKMVELFGGYGATKQGIKEANIDCESVGISEWNVYSLIAYDAVHTDDGVDYSEGKSKQELIEELSKFTFSTDGHSPCDIKKLKEDLLRKLYSANKRSNNLGSIIDLKVEDIPDCDLITYSYPCFAKGTLVQTINGFKPIEEIECDDYVLTHNNRYKKVVTPMSKMANKIYELKTMCSEKILVTEEHPFYVREKYHQTDLTLRHKSRKAKRVRKFKNPEWKPVKELSKNYYVGTPVNNIEENYIWEGATIKNQWGHPDVIKNEISEHINKEDFWWLMGRYLGDGWQRYDGGIVICSADTKTKKIEDVRNIIERLGINYCEAKERTVTKFFISKQEYGEFCKQFGLGAINKYIPQKVLNLPINLLKSFIDGYISADGCFTKGQFQASSISQKLVYTLAQAIHKVYKTHCSVSVYKRNPTCIIEGRTVNQHDSYNISFKKERKKQDKGFYEDGYIWTPVNSIIEVEFNDYVYNMEVEEDNSYIVQNIIVHNCQSISISGKQEGLTRDSGTASSLLWECDRIIKAKKPKYLLMENVKNLISKKFKPEFDSWCKLLEDYGYKNYYQVLNAKDYELPQNRERVFMISVRNDIDKPFIFPNKIDLKFRLKDFLDDDVADNYYLSEEYYDRFLNSNFKMDNDIKIVGTTVNPEAEGTNSRHWVHDTSGIIDTIDATTYKQPKQILVENPVRLGNIYGEDKGTGFAGNVWDKEAISPTLTTMQGGNRQPMVVVDKSIKHCVAKNFEKELDEIAISEKDIYQAQCDSGWQDNKIGLKISQTIRANNSFAPVLDNNFTIRKLTPLECFRLMGMSDENFYKIKAKGISDSQLYKLAGNSICVNVLKHIFISLFQ